MYHPLYHLVWRVGNASDICVTGVTYVLTSFSDQFSDSFGLGSVLVRQNRPVLELQTSFEPGVVTKLAVTFRWNCNVLLSIDQFTSFVLVARS